MYHILMFIDNIISSDKEQEFIYDLTASVATDNKTEWR